MHCPGRFSRLVLLALALFWSACGSSGNSKWWRLPHYDQRGTGFYPFPSESKTSLDEFGLLWSLDEVSMHSPALVDLTPDAGLEIVLTRYPSPGFAGSNQVAMALRGDGTPIDSIPGSVFVGAVPMDGELLLLVSKYHYREPVPDPGSDLCELLYQNLRFMLALDPFELTSKKMRAELSTTLESFRFSDGMFRKSAMNALVSGIGPMVLLDLDDDGTYRIVSVKHPGYYDSSMLYQLVKRETYGAGKPNYKPYMVDDYVTNVRSVMLIDLEDGSLEWSFPTAAGLYIAGAEDLTGDGAKEMILEGFSPHNAVSTNNTTDFGQGYVLALDKEGNLLWRYEHPGLFLRYRACVLKKGKEKLVVCTSSSYFGLEGQVTVLEGSNGVVRKNREERFSFLGLTVFDADGDGEEEIYTGSSIGKVFRMDADLNVIDAYEHSSGEVSGRSGSGSIETRRAVVVLAANDVDGDGEVEVFGVEAEYSGENSSIYGDNLQIQKISLVIFSSSLEVEKRITLSERQERGSMDTSLLCFLRNAAIGDVNGDGSNELLLIHEGKLQVFGVGGEPAP